MSEHITMPIGSTLEPEQLLDWQDQLEAKEIDTRINRMMGRLALK